MVLKYPFKAFIYQLFTGRRFSKPAETNMKIRNDQAGLWNKTTPPDRHLNDLSLEQIEAGSSTHHC
jgi:hypothetical protein